MKSLLKPRFNLLLTSAFIYILGTGVCFVLHPFKNSLHSSDLRLQQESPLSHFSEKFL